MKNYSDWIKKALSDVVSNNVIKKSICIMSDIEGKIPSTTELVNKSQYDTDQQICFW